MFHRVTQFDQQVIVGFAVAPLAKAPDQLSAARRPYAARRTLSAGFQGAKLECKLRQVGHVGRVVEDHYAAVAEHRTSGHEGFVVEGQIQSITRNMGAQWPTHLDGLDRPSAQRATTPVVHQGFERHAEGNLDQSAATDVAGELHGQSAPGLAAAELGVFQGAVSDDAGHRRERNDVVDQCRRAEQALDGGQRRLGSHDASFTLQALEHRGFLAANIRARADVKFDVESEPAAP